MCSLSISTLLREYNMRNELVFDQFGLEVLERVYFEKAEKSEGCEKLKNPEIRKMIKKIWKSKNQYFLNFVHRK
jgi:hypothetical protein